MPKVSLKSDININIDVVVYFDGRKFVSIYRVMRHQIMTKGRQMHNTPETEFGKSTVCPSVWMQTGLGIA